MHEHTRKHEMPLQRSSDRSFGFVFTAVFLLVGLYPLASGHMARSWALALAAAFLLCALFVPKGLAPLNRYWAKFGMLLHSVVSPIALGILFFLVVTPIGLLMRLLGKDVLRKRFHSDADSYWIERDPPGPNARSLNNQF